MSNHKVTAHKCAESKQCRLFGGPERFGYRDCAVQYRWNERFKKILSQDGKVYKQFMEACAKSRHMEPVL